MRREAAILDQASARERYWRRNLAALCVAQLVTQIAFNFAEPFLPLFLLTMDVGGTCSAWIATKRSMSCRSRKAVVNAGDAGGTSRR